MRMWGADPERLLAIARGFEAASTALFDSAASADGAVQAVEWAGPDHDRYLESWAQVRAELERLADVQQLIAEHLGSNAAQQELCSAPGGVADLSAYDGLLGGSNVLIDLGNFFDDHLFGRGQVDTGSPRFTDDGVFVRSDGTVLRPEDIAIDERAFADAIMQQGQQNDCWLLGGMMAVADTDPALLARNISGLGQPPGSDGWEVRLYVDGVWQTVHVAPGDLGNRGATQLVDGMTQPGAFSILEQAYITAVDGQESKVRADNPEAGLRVFLGPQAEITNYGQLGLPSAETVHRAIEDGHPTTIVTTLLGTASDPDLVPAHVYQVVAADPEAGTITVRNPWGPDGSMPYDVTIDLDRTGSILELSIADPTPPLPPGHDVIAPGPLGSPSQPSVGEPA